MIGENRLQWNRKVSSKSEPLKDLGCQKSWDAWIKVPEDFCSKKIQKAQPWRDSFWVIQPDIRRAKQQLFFFPYVVWCYMLKTYLSQGGFFNPKRHFDWQLQVTDGSGSAGFFSIQTETSKKKCFFCWWRMVPPVWPTGRANCFWKCTPPSPKVITMKGNCCKNSLMKQEAIISEQVYSVLYKLHEAGK